MGILTEEQKWIEKARTGDADAFCSLYGLYRNRLYRYAFYRLRSEADAEDAVSECVLSAWRQIGSLREPDAFCVWIFRILSGCCSRLIRQQIQRREQVSLDHPSAGELTGTEGSPAVGSAEARGGQPGHPGSPGHPATEPGGTDSPDTWLILEEALAQLSEEERNIVLLSAVGGLKSHEIAELTGRTAGSVRSSLSRSLKKVRGYLS